MIGKLENKTASLTTRTVSRIPKRTFETRIGFRLS
jgi:hypothetical protein